MDSRGLSCGDGERDAAPILHQCVEAVVMRSLVEGDAEPA
jgi:hypothetical protein